MEKFKEKNKSEGNESTFNKSLMKYSLVAGAALTMAQPGNAEIICSSPDGSGVINDQNTAFYVDLDGDTQADFRFYFTSATYSQYYGNYATILMKGINDPSNAFDLDTYGPYPSYAEPLVARLNQGFSVGPGAGPWIDSSRYGDLNGSFFYYTTGSPPYGYWKTYANFVDQTGCIGVRFEAGDGQIHYGWIEYQGSNSGDGVVSGEVLEWGYETTPNTAVPACECDIILPPPPPPPPTEQPIPSLNHIGLLILAGLILAGGARTAMRRKEDE